MVYRLYYVDCGPIHFYGTLEEAKHAADERAIDSNADVNVDQFAVPERKAAVVALANGQTPGAVTVYTAKRPSRTADDDSYD